MAQIIAWSEETLNMTPIDVDILVKQASASASASQLRAWEAEAEKMTADSYATQVEDSFIVDYTSNADGTFTGTPTTEYSALHWAAKADTAIQSEVDLNTAKRSYPLVDENKLATIATNADVTADNETSHADVVVAPLGVLPVLDGSNLTNLPSVGGITAHGDLTGIGTLTHDQLETAIGLNTAKISFDSTSSSRLANTSGTNTGDQDLSGLQPLSTDLTNIDALVGNLGFLKKTALNTWVLDTNTYLTSETSHPSDSLDSTDITNIGNLSGVNTGDQDLSGYSVTTHNHDLVYEPIDSTILKDADIGSTVQAYDADTAKTDVGQAYTKMQRSTITTDNDGIFDLTNGTNDFKCTPTATIAITFTNILSGAKGDIILVNTTPQVITLAAGTKAPSGTATALSTAGTYRIAYLSDGTNTYIDYSEAMV